MLRLESIYAPIRRYGSFRAAAMASTLLSCATVGLATLNHWLAGAELEAVDVLNSVLIPFALGLPILVLMFRLVDKLERARAELQHLSTYDGTTRAYNRRYLIATAESLCERARAIGEPISLILMDADLFKQVNDKYGHLAGDTVLRRLVRIVHACIEPGEIYGRYGGEEFAIFLPGAGLDAAGERAEQIRRAIAVGEVLHAGRTIKTTVSMGVAQAHGAHATVNGLIARADAALYAAKRSGRNRTELALE